MRKYFFMPNCFKSSNFNISTKVFCVQLFGKKPKSTKNGKLVENFMKTSSLVNKILRDF